MANAFNVFAVEELEPWWFKALCFLLCFVSGSSLHGSQVGYEADQKRSGAQISWEEIIDQWFSNDYVTIGSTGCQSITEERGDDSSMSIRERELMRNKFQNSLRLSKSFRKTEKRKWQKNNITGLKAKKCI